MTAPAMPRTGVGSTLYKPGPYANGDSDFEEVYTAPLAEFFSAFENFSLDPTARSTDEFNRLILTVGVKKAKQLRRDFNEALVSEFVMAYGKSNSLYAWHSLCGDIGIDPIPATVKKCQMAVQSSFVNIVDLLHARKTGAKVQRFASVKELAEYTTATGRFFPKDMARGNLLSGLLRMIGGIVPRKRNKKKKKKEVPQDKENSQQQKESGQAGRKRKKRNRARRRARFARRTAAATGTASAPPAIEVSV